MTGERYLNHPAIMSLLNRFIDRLDRQGLGDRNQRVTEKPTPRYFADLFNPIDPGDDQILWELIKEVAEDNIIELEIIRKKPNPLSHEWENYRLIFREDAEAKVRSLLDRPRESVKDIAWRLAVDRNKAHFKNLSLLECMPGFLSSHEPDDVVERLCRIPEILDSEPMTAYQLSARVFWGDSKVLRDREDWVRDLFDLSSASLLERPILVEVSLPDGEPESVLMIENLDSYLAAAEGRWSGCDRSILVYTQGFRGSSPKIRDPAHVRLHYSGSSLNNQTTASIFKDAWLNGTFEVPVYFSGDLDWSGLRIFASLKNIFHELLPWIPAYQQMLDALERGDSHSPNTADKEGQIPIGSAANDWLDTYVIPVLEKHQRFVDQEIVS